MWWAKLELDNSMTPSAKHTCATHHPEVTEMLNAQIMMACKDGFLLTGDLIHKKWWSFADMHGVPQDKWLNLSEGWLSKYKSWMGLKGVKHHGEAASASTEAVMAQPYRWTTFLLLYLSYLPFVPLFYIALFQIWTILSWLIRADSYCTIMTHPRIPVLGPEGCTMTHELTLWLTLVCTHIL